MIAFLGLLGFCGCVLSSMCLLDFRLYSSVFVHMYVLFTFGCVCICMCTLQCLVHCLLELGGGVSPRLYMHQTPISGLPTMVKIKLYRNIGIQECSSGYVIFQEYRNIWLHLCNCVSNTPFCQFNLNKILSHREKKEWNKNARNSLYQWRHPTQTSRTYAFRGNISEWSQVPKKPHN